MVSSLSSSSSDSGQLFLMECDTFLGKVQRENESTLNRLSGYVQSKLLSIAQYFDEKGKDNKPLERQFKMLVDAVGRLDEDKRVQAIDRAAKYISTHQPENLEFYRSVLFLDKSFTYESFSERVQTKYKSTLNRLPGYVQSKLLSIAQYFDKKKEMTRS